jgi:hypothetical protein
MSRKRTPARSKRAGVAGIDLRGGVEGECAQIGAHEASARNVQRHERHVDVGCVCRLLDARKARLVGRVGVFGGDAATEPRELLDERLVDAFQQRRVAVDRQCDAAAVLPRELRHLPCLRFDLQVERVDFRRDRGAALRDVQCEGWHQHRRALGKRGDASARERANDHPRSRSERLDVGLHGLLGIVARGVDAHRQAASSVELGGGKEPVPHRLGVPGERG